MANTLSVMTNVLRNVVSKQRIRYKEKGFNLDLAYICDNIIAMGYPADNIEKIYRNRLEDVYKFLEENHNNHYKIYNLCLERSYDVKKFHNRVAVYPFEDHNPPTIELIEAFCNDVDSWLKLNENNVAAVHCKAGKGRTGTMICCYLLYSGHQKTAENALAFYDEKRTKDKKGVTIPSQRRYVQYFSKLINSGASYEKISLKLCEIRFVEPCHYLSLGMLQCSVFTLQNSAYHPKQQLVYTATVDFRKSSYLNLDYSDLMISGDVKVELTHKTSKKSLFHFWFNTYFVVNYEADTVQKGDRTIILYTLHKSEIDDAHKDKEHKSFPENFKVQTVLCCINNCKPLKKQTNDCNKKALYSDEKSDLMLQNGISQPPMRLLDHDRTPEPISDTSVKPVYSSNGKLLNENGNMMVAAERSFNGISPNRTLDTFEILSDMDMDHSDFEVNKKKVSESLNKISNHQLNISAEHEKLNNIVEATNTNHQPSSKIDCFDIHDHKCRLSVGRNNSNTSSNLSDTSSKKYIFEDDWESGESTYL